MPFPLAHPAAVLPLRRYCARWLHFPALVIGSLVPDAGYLFPNEEIGALSHQLLGSIAFGLPSGLLILAALYVFRKFAVEMLPTTRGRMFLALCQRPRGSFWLVILSLLIGIWSHVFWDSFTHGGGWISLHLSVLQTPLFQFGGRTARLCHLLWYVSSFAGVGWLFVAFESWKWNSEPQPAGKRSRSMIQDAIWMAALVVPVSLLHHLVRSPIVFVLTAVLCVLLVVVFFVKMTSPRRDTPV